MSRGTNELSQQSVRNDENRQGTCRYAAVAWLLRLYCVRGHACVRTVPQLDSKMLMTAWAVRALRELNKSR